MKKHHSTTQSIAIVGGKSGGHLIPALTLAQTYKKQNPSNKILAFTTTSELDYFIIQKYPFVTHIPLLATSPTPSLKHWLLFIPTLLSSIIRSYRILRNNHVSILISTGGILSLPVCIGARLARIPIHLYELNAVPGKASSYIHYCATHVFVCFEKASAYFPKQKTTLAPYPIQFRFKKKWKKEEAYRYFGFTEQAVTILVLGGSQGSLFINNLMQSFLEQYPVNSMPIQIIHQTGHLLAAQLQTFYNAKGIKAVVFPYHHAIEISYTISDLIICRAGAGTLFESLYFNTPLITIPLETISTDHQLFNAQECAKKFPHLVTLLEQQTIEKNSTMFYQTLMHHIEKARKRITSL